MIQKHDEERRKENERRQRRVNPVQAMRPTIIKERTDEKESRSSDWWSWRSLPSSCRLRPVKRATRTSPSTGPKSSPRATSRPWSTTSGTLNPVDLVDVGSQVSGKIIKLYADFNSQVKAGQIVAELDLDLLQAKVDQNQSNYESRLASPRSGQGDPRQRQEEVRPVPGPLRQEPDLLRGEGDGRVQLSERQGRPHHRHSRPCPRPSPSSIRARSTCPTPSSARPIDGVVITRNVNIGQTVAASMTAPVLFKVASDLTKMQLTCAVDEADIGKIKEGQKVRFTVDAFQGETFNGDVQQVRNSARRPSRTSSPTRRSSTPRTPTGKLRPGMTATVSIITGEAKGVLKVPNSAMRFTPRPSTQGARRSSWRTMRARDGPAASGGQPRADRAARPDGQPGQTGSAPGRRPARQGGQRGGQRMSGRDDPRAAPGFQQRHGQSRRGGRHGLGPGRRRASSSPTWSGPASPTTPIPRSPGGELKEGMKIILGEATPGARPRRRSRAWAAAGRRHAAWMMFRPVSPAPREGYVSWKRTSSNWKT